MDIKLPLNLISHRLSRQFIYVHSWPSGKLTFYCQKNEFFCKKIAKKCHFWQFFLKKCQVFGNFLTFKWPFSGGSGIHIGDGLQYLGSEWPITSLNNKSHKMFHFDFNKLVFLSRMSHSYYIKSGFISGIYCVWVSVIT